MLQLLWEILRSAKKWKLLLMLSSVTLYLQLACILPAYDPVNVSLSSSANLSSVMLLYIVNSLQSYLLREYAR